MSMVMHVPEYSQECMYALQADAQAHHSRCLLRLLHQSPGAYSRALPVALPRLAGPVVLLTAMETAAVDEVSA